MPRVGRAGAVAALASCVWVLSGWRAPTTRLVVENLLLLSVSTFAVLCAGRAARQVRGRQRAAWTCFTIASAGWVLGSVRWFSYQWWQTALPFPSPADIGYLLFPVFMGIGLLLVPVGDSKYARSRLGLDGLIVALACFQIGWFVMPRELIDLPDPNPWAAGLELSYPILDLAALTIAVLVLGRVHTVNRRMLSLLTAGLALVTVGDVVFLYATLLGDSGQILRGSMGWALGLLMIGLAARSVATARDAAHQDASPPAVWVPYMPIAMVVLAALVRFVTAARSMAPALAVWLILLVLLMLRQFMMVRENRRLLTAMEDQAFRDPLTGLANGALFRDRLAHAVTLSQRDSKTVAVLSLDLDDFRLVNDGLGHDAGDLLLRKVGERIVSRVRAGDTVARMGGDEFMVLMEGSEGDSRLVARNVVRAFDQPFVIEVHELQLRPSVGLAITDIDDLGMSAKTLLERAEAAMAAAKRARTAGVHTYCPDDMSYVPGPEDKGNAGASAHDSAVAYQLLGQLRQAIDNRELTLAYQPKFDLVDGSIAGVEALVRWPHPDRGLLGPDQFLQLVRDHGLMRPINDLVLTRALDQIARWRDLGQLVPVAVNVFAPSLSDLTVPTRIQQALSQRELPCEILTVEITEDLLLGNQEHTRAVIEQLRERGVRVAIDDFGSGYSALSYLRELHVDELKLDRGFVTAVLGDRRAAAIVRAVIDLARELGLTTVAEGVENAETATMLRDYGCQVAQGYLYSPPLSPADMLSLLRSCRPEPDAAISS